jgi:hypothetical protein
MGDISEGVADTLQPAKKISKKKKKKVCGLNDLVIKFIVQQMCSQSNYPIALINLFLFIQNKWLFILSKGPPLKKMS